MFENIGSFFRRIVKPEQKELASKDAAKERLHLVLMQDRANVSSEFLELMKQEILDVIKKNIIVDESLIDVRLTNQQNEDGTNGAPSLYANIPIVNIKNEMLVGKVKEFDSKTNSINFGEYKMVIETPSNVDEENIENIENIENTENVENVEANTEEVVENVVPANTEVSITEVAIDELTEEEKQEVVEEIKEDIKGKIEEVKEALAEEQSKKEEVIEEVEEQVEENNEDELEEEEKEEPVIIFNDDDEDDLDDDDDVTFDDLLKQAEEEDRKLAEAAKKEKNESQDVKVQHNNRNKSNKSKNNKRKGKK